MTIDPSKTYTATIKTDVGTITVQLDAKTAPKAVNSFVFLANHNYYNCLIFHRVIPTFMDQTGDPTGTGSGGPRLHSSPSEVPEATASPQYPLGSVAMAKTSAARTDLRATSSSSWPAPRASRCRRLRPVRQGHLRA